MYLLPQVSYVKFKQSDLATPTVQNMLDRFATGLEQAKNKFSPVIKAGTRDGFPWINRPPDEET